MISLCRRIGLLPEPRAEKDKKLENHAGALDLIQAEARETARDIEKLKDALVTKANGAMHPLVEGKAK